MKLTFFGHLILRTYNHYVYKLNYENFKPATTNRLQAFELMPETVDLIRGTTVLKEQLTYQKDFVLGFGFRDGEGNIVGHVFAMTKGGTERLYKIRKINAYLYALRVYEEYRGQGYAGEIVTFLIRKLHEMDLDEVYLTCLKDNASALKVYDRAGFKVVGSRFFIRLWRFNIPYYSL